MSRVRQELSVVQFQVETRQASASMDALRERAKDLNKNITTTKENIKALGDVKPDDAALVAYQTQLKKLNSDLRDVTRAQNELMKGVKAADKLWKAAATGTMESLSMKEIKSGQRGMQARMQNLQPSKENEAMLRAMKAAIEEGDIAMRKFEADTAHLLETINQGGAVSNNVLTKAKNDLLGLLDVLPRGTEEWNDYNAQLQSIKGYIDNLSTSERRLAGEVVTVADAMKMAGAVEKEAAEMRAATAKEALAKRKEELAAAQQQMDTSKQNIETTERELATTKEQIEAQQKLVDSLETLHTAEDKADKDADEAREAVRKLREEQKPFADAVMDAANKVGELKRKLEELNAAWSAPKGNATLEKLKQDIESTIDELGQLESQWQDKITDYIFKKYPTQATVSAKTKSPEGLKEREAMKNDPVLDKMREQSKQEQDAVDQKLTQLIRQERELAEATKEETAATRSSVDVDKQKAEIQQQLADARTKLDAAKKAAEEPTKKLMQAEEALTAAEKKADEATKSLNESRKNSDYKGETEKLDALERQHDELTESLQKQKQAERELAQAAAEAQQKEMDAAIELAQAQNVTQESIENAISILEKQQKKTADGTPQYEKQAEALDKLRSRLNEMKGEWMSLADAQQLAGEAGTKAFIASPELLQKATAAIERRKKQLQETIQLQRRSGEATDAEEKELRELEAQLKQLKVEQDNFNMSHSRMETLLKQPTNAKNLDELRAAVKRAKAELNAMEDSLGKNSGAYQEMAESTKKAEFQLKQMEAQAKGTATAFDKAWSRLKTYVSLYMGAAVAIQKLVGTLGDLMDLSDKMGEVRKTTGFTADEVGRLSNNLSKLDTRTSLVSLMELGSLAGSVGLKTQKDVQGFVEAADQLIVALPEMGNESARTLIKIATATGDLQKNNNDVRETLEKVGSTIIALRANSASAAGPITDFVSRVGAVGAQAGISIDQIAALGSTIDALGGRVEMSATALSRMIPAIRNNAFGVANAIGVTEKTLADLFNQGKAMEAMVLIFEKMRNSVQRFDTSTEEGQEAMAKNVEDLLGKNATMKEVMTELNQQGARAGIVFGLLSQNVEELKKQLGIAGDAYRENTALLNEYNNMNTTTAAKWARLKNQIEEFVVGDTSQRWLGSIIDGLRKLVDFIAEDGWIAKGLKVIAAYIFALRSGIGSTFIGAGAAFKNLATAVLAAAGNLGIFTRATAEARVEWKKMDAAMKANIGGAIVTALSFVLYKIWDIHKAAKEAAAEVGRFNQKLSDEKNALDKLFEPLNKSNMAQDERLRLINDINSKYSRYLGFMLSETTSAIQLADAHALIAKRIREEAYEKRILEQEGKVRSEYDEDLNARYGGLQNAASQYVKGNTTGSEVADAIKGYIDRNLRNVDNDFYMGSLRQSNESVQKVLSGVDKLVERLIADGKLSRDATRDMRALSFQYLSVAKEQSVEMERATANTRSELRSVQNSIRGDINANLNNLVNNIKNFGTSQQPTPVLPTTPKDKTPAQQWSELMSGVGQHNWQGNAQVQANVPMPLPSERPSVNKKDIEQVKQYVEMQDQLRSYLQANAGRINEQTRKTAEMYLDSEEEVEKLRALLPQQSSGGTSGGTTSDKPYGDFNRVISPYEEWDADSLVARRKEMLERVRALANGADVQRVLSEDAKFITEATRNNIKTTKQAIEWYNTERLKIQEALHDRYLTNTGDWQDPKKSGRKASKMVQDEMKYYLDELDAYYTERKTRIQAAATEEGVTEAEVRNRTLANEMEWRQRRAELQRLYAKKSEQVTQEEQNAIFDILSDRTGETIGYIQKDIEQTVKFIEKVGKEKGESAMKRILGDLDLTIERDLLKQQQAVTAQMKAIQDIIDKERPFNGITKNLRENLVTMGILTADMTKERNKLMAEGADMTAFNTKQAEAELKRTAFILGEAEHAYSTTINDVMGRMGKAGMQAWADAIRQSPEMQEAMMAQLRSTYDQIQEAIKKEASLMKKQAETMWNNILLPGGDGKTTIKDAYEKAIAGLSLAEGRVSRANSLIGAGQASERVADKLAIKQMQLQLTMQQHYFNLMRKQGKQRIDDLERQAKLLEEQGRLEEASRVRQDKKHAAMSLNLAMTKEHTTLLKQQEDIIAKVEESQAKLYKELREWADLFYSSIQNVFEASNAGNAEYYNERARIRLEGEAKDDDGNVERKQYVVIENEGTEGAEAHYETLSELEYLNRQHEIEQENARADAWKQMMDDINQKMSDTITDQINAMMQNASVDANTDATRLNTEAIQGLTETVARGTEATTNSQIVPDAPTQQGGVTVVNTNPSVDVGAPIPAGIIPDEEGDNTTGSAITGTNRPVAPWPMTEEQMEKYRKLMQQLWTAYTDQGVEAEQLMGERLTEIPNAVLPPWQITEDGLGVAVERMQELWQAYADAGIDAMQQMSDAMDELPNEIPNPVQISDEQRDKAIANFTAVTDAQGAASSLLTNLLTGNKKKQADDEKKGNKEMTASSQSMYAKMTQAANLYGVAYQAMSNDNLDTAQKFEVIALQAAGNAAMAALTADWSGNTAAVEGSLPVILAKCLGISPIWGSVLFAALTATLGGLMGLAASKVAKGKSEIAQATGATNTATTTSSVKTNVGRLKTGMLTYAEGNVNEFTDPSTLNSGRYYNVDGADGKTYRAKYMGKNAKTHITNGPEFHLVGEAGREAIIDAHTTRNIQMNEPEIWRSIQTLYNGGSLSHMPRRRSGMPAFADGNIDDFDSEMAGGISSVSGSGMNAEQVMMLQASLDRNSEVLERALAEGIQGVFNVYGPDGLVDTYDTAKRTLNRHGERR